MFFYGSQGQVHSFAHGKLCVRGKSGHHRAGFLVKAGETASQEAVDGQCNRKYTASQCFGIVR